MTNLHFYSNIYEVGMEKFVAYYEGRRIANAGKLENEERKAEVSS